MTQDELADRLRQYGLRWTRSTVGKLERGERGVDIVQLGVIATALGTKADRLVDGDDWIAFGGGSRVRAGAVAQILRGEETSPGDWDVPFMREGRVEAGAQASRARDEGWLEISDERLAYQGSFGELERRAARRLGVDPVVVSIAAVRLWRRTLTAERDRRAEAADRDAPARSVQARRGHASRALIEELGQHRQLLFEMNESYLQKGQER